MDSSIFYPRIEQAAARPPLERHALFAGIHADVVGAYLRAVRKITPEQASQISAPGSDKRTLAQVVGHIAAWEQFTILACGDILAGSRHPRTVTAVEGFIDADGKTLIFSGVDAFNAFHAERHAQWGWDPIQSLAVDCATALHALFTHPDLLSAARLERTLPFYKQLKNGTTLRDLTMGWVLWIIALEHEAVEHAAELGLSGP